jgi:hypothetical protein
MTDSFKREIERLLDEPGELPEGGNASERLRSRLTATLSEGLSDVSEAPSDFDAADFASIAAFVDGRLTGDARDKFANALVQQHSLRADVESSAELVHGVVAKAANGLGYGGRAGCNPCRARGSDSWQPARRNGWRRARVECCLRAGR